MWVGNTQYSGVSGSIWNTYTSLSNDSVEDRFIGGKNMNSGEYIIHSLRVTDTSSLYSK